MATNGSAIDHATESAADDAKSFVGRASDAMSSGFNDAADYVVSGVKTMTDRSDDAASWAGDQLEMIRTRVEEEPIKALAIAAGIGAVLGLLFLRR